MQSQVAVVPYSSDWPLQFERMRVELIAVFEHASIQVEHIGSTAVPGLAAKPVVDVLLGADALAVIESSIGDLGRLGYAYVSRYESELPMRRYFTRDASRNSARVHLHGVVCGSLLWQRHLAFRDALRSDAALRAAYQSLKLELAARFPDDKASYTAAKEPFIRSILDALRV